MLRSTAIIGTSRADRYRDQLARHGMAMVRRARSGGSEAAAPIRDATATDESVVLELAWGPCTVKAAQGALTLIAEAATHEDLAKIEAGVGQRVIKIGRRDGLVVIWAAAKEESSEGVFDVAKQRHSSVRLIVGLAVLTGILAVIHAGRGSALVRLH